MSSGCFYNSIRGNRDERKSGIEIMDGYGKMSFEMLNQYIKEGMYKERKMSFEEFKELLYAGKSDALFPENIPQNAPQDEIVLNMQHEKMPDSVSENQTKPVRGDTAALDAYIRSGLFGAEPLAPRIEPEPVIETPPLNNALSENGHAPQVLAKLPAPKYKIAGKPQEKTVKRLSKPERKKAAQKDFNSGRIVIRGVKTIPRSRIIIQ